MAKSLNNCGNCKFYSHEYYTTGSCKQIMKFVTTQNQEVYGTTMKVKKAFGCNQHKPNK